MCMDQLHNVCHPIILILLFDALIVLPEESVAII